MLGLGYNQGMTQRCYVESDGRIFLVARDDMLDLPTKDEIPFEVDPISVMGTSDDVVFCVPRLDAHPAHWISKDAVPGDGRVTPRVRQAVHASMPRVVSEAIIVQEGKVLLVKGSRGFTEGRWTLPGGFVRFGEDPAEGLARELNEELGVQAHDLHLVNVRSKVGSRSRLHWTLFFYRAAISGQIRPCADEISKACFLPLEEAIQSLDDPTMQDVLRGLVVSSR